MAGIRIKDEPVDSGYDLAESGGIKIQESMTTSPLEYASMPVAPTTKPMSVSLNLVSLPSTMLGVSKSESLPQYTMSKPGTSLLGGNIIQNSTQTVKGKSQPVLIIRSNGPRPMNTVSTAKQGLPIARFQQPRLLRPSAPGTSLMQNKVVYSNTQQRAVILSSNSQQRAVVQPIPKPIYLQKDTPYQPKPLVIEPTNDDGTPKSVVPMQLPGSKSVPDDFLSSLILTGDITVPPPHMTDTKHSKSGQTQTVCSIVYNKDQNNRDKVYLCNFCKYSSPSCTMLNKHLTEHVFSCNHCSFKAFTRFQVLMHRRNKHPTFNHELAGYRGFGEPSVTVPKPSFHKLITSPSEPQNVTLDNSVKASPTNLLLTSSPNTATTPATIMTTSKTPTFIKVGGAETNTVTTQAINICPIESKDEDDGLSDTTSPCTNPQKSPLGSLAVGSPQKSPLGGLAAGSPHPNLRSMLTQSSESSTETPTSKKLWKCYYCEERSEVQAELVQHIKGEHPGMPFKLQSISRITKGHRTPPRDSDVDELQASKQFMWACYYCDTTNSDRNSIISHVKAEHKNSKIVIRRKKVGSPEGKSSGDEGPPTLTRFDNEHRSPISKSASSETMLSNKSSKSGGGDSPRQPTLEPQCFPKVEPVSVVKDKTLQESKEARPKTFHSNRKDKTSHTKGKTKIIVSYEYQDSEPPEDTLMMVDRENKVAKCLSCSKIIRGKGYSSHMREHILSHTSFCPWQCALCSSQYKRRSSAFIHFQENHTDLPIELIRYTTDQKLIGQTIETVAEQKDQALTKPKTPTRPSKAKTLLLGPRSARENYIRKHAVYMWKCPYCSRHSVHKGLILGHIKFVHPSKRISVDPWKIRRPTSQFECQEKDKYDKKKKAAVHLIRLEDMTRYAHLDSILKSGGECLIQDMDQDDNEVLMLQQPTRQKATAKKPNRPTKIPTKYTCKVCRKVFMALLRVKKHVIESHSNEEVAAYVSSPKGNLSTLFLCSNISCRFSSVLKPMMDVHYVRNPSHRQDKSSLAAAQSIATPRLAQSILKNNQPMITSAQKVDSDIPVIEQSAMLPVATAQRERVEMPQYYITVPSTAPGSVQRPPPVHKQPVSVESTSPPILFQEPASKLSEPSIPLTLGTVKCLYCDFPATPDHHALKNHLLLEHPTENPRVANIYNTNHDGRPSGDLTYLCPMFLCEYFCIREKQIENHITSEHPDMEFNIPLMGKHAGNPASPKKKKRKQNDSDDERDLDFDPRRPFFDPDFPKLGGKKAKLKKSKQERVLDPNEPSQDVSDPNNLSQDKIAGPSTEKNKLSKRKISSSDSKSKRPRQQSLFKLRDTSQQLYDVPGVFVCTVCKKVCELRSAIKAHMLECHQNVALICTDIIARKKHKRSQVRLCPVEDCKFFTTMDEDSIKRHMYTDHPEKWTETHFGSKYPEGDTSFGVSPQPSSPPAEKIADIASKLSVPCATVSDSSDSSRTPTTPDINSSKVKQLVDNITKGDIVCMAKDFEDELTEGEKHPETKLKSSRSDSKQLMPPSNRAVSSSVMPPTTSTSTNPVAEHDGGVTEKAFTDIGEELNRLNKDLETLFGTGKSSPVNPSEDNIVQHSAGDVALDTKHSSRTGSIEQEHQSSEASSTARHQHWEDYCTGDNGGNTRTNQFTADDDDDTSATVSDVERDSDSDDREMPDITADRFSPKTMAQNEHSDLQHCQDDSAKANSEHKLTVEGDVSHPLRDTDDDSHHTPLIDRLSGTEDIDSREADSAHRANPCNASLNTSAPSGSGNSQNEDRTLVCSSPQPNRPIAESSKTDNPCEDTVHDSGLDSSSIQTAKRDSDIQVVKPSDESFKTAEEEHSKIEEERQEEHRCPASDCQEQSSDTDEHRPMDNASANKGDAANGGAKMYQCHECLFMTTSLSNIEKHVNNDHEDKDAGFMEIDTGFDQEGNIITSVNG